MHDCKVCHPGDPRQVSPPVYDDINIITEEAEEEEKEEDEETLRYIRVCTGLNSQALEGKPSNRFGWKFLPI